MEEGAFEYPNTPSEVTMLVQPQAQQTHTLPHKVVASFAPHKLGARRAEAFVRLSKTRKQLL
jgi:hypothetical protein